jgi:hypothetical protein
MQLLQATGSSSLPNRRAVCSEKRTVEDCSCITLDPVPQNRFHPCGGLFGETSVNGLIHKTDNYCTMCVGYMGMCAGQVGKPDGVRRSNLTVGAV